MDYANHIADSIILNLYIQDDHKRRIESAKSLYLYINGATVIDAAILYKSGEYHDRIEYGMYK